MQILYHKNGQIIKTSISNATFVKAWTEKQTAGFHIDENYPAVFMVIILAIIVSILMFICYLAFIVKCHKQKFYKNSQNFECDHSFEIAKITKISKMACQIGAKDFSYRRLTILPGGTSCFVRKNGAFSDCGFQNQKRCFIDRGRLATI